VPEVVVDRIPDAGGVHDQEAARIRTPAGKRPDSSRMMTTPSGEVLLAVDSMPR